MAYSLIQWAWTQGGGGTCDGFNVKCGRTSGSYSVVTPVANPLATSISIYTATTGRGLWFCTITATNAVNGSSVDATELQFVLPVIGSTHLQLGFGF